MDRGKEFRCFVPPAIAAGLQATVDKLRLSAVSQYRWPFEFSHANDFPIHKIAEAVVSGATTLLEDMKEYITSSMDVHIGDSLVKHGFTFDVVVQKIASVQLVEVNPFGAMSGCGACLFHWLRDARLMYGFEEEIEFRITAGPMCTKHCAWGCEVIGGCACLEQEWKMGFHVHGGEVVKSTGGTVEGSEEEVEGPEKKMIKGAEEEAMVGLTGYACEVMRRWKHDYIALTN
jgi:hypothetical protein